MVQPRPSPSGLTTLGQAALDRRLDTKADAPIAVAYSGGGDSLAALIAVKTWADRHGRRVVALHVDHRLQPSSDAWADGAQAVARSLGLACEILPWMGEKPTRGLPAAARQARHSLIAGAARALGARAIVFGHTADDEREAALMRLDGASLGRLAEWRPSPVWPQGRDLFLLRPLLDHRRAALRDWLGALSYPWIDDPANDDPRYARARARTQLAAQNDEAPPIGHAEDPALADLARGAQVSAAGAIVIARTALTNAPAQAARRFLSAALTCAGGGDRPARRERLEAMIARLRAPGALIATLAGAKLAATEKIIITREAGAFRRYGTPVQSLEPDLPTIWDGRFALEPRTSSALTVGPLVGVATKLPSFQRNRLSDLPREARPTLPVIWDEAGAATCPILAEDSPVTAKCLVEARLLAVCGVISKESEI